VLGGCLCRFGPFKLRVLERPSKTPLLQAQAEAALAAELAKRPPKARPPPPPPVSEVGSSSSSGSGSDSGSGSISAVQD
jgi:hypothetical protein